MLTITFASTSAPFASSISTTSKWPSLEAKRSGVHPNCGAEASHASLAVSVPYSHHPDQPSSTITRRVSR
jgi:hypothetical protein